MSSTKHKNYELLNLIGYGLAKFDNDFIKQFGFSTKIAFYQHLVQKGVAETIGTVKNRQDLFDPFFDNGRKGWWQKGNTYEHRKILIDALYGELDVELFANIVKLQLNRKLKTSDITNEERSLKKISPILRSQFNQLQITGQKAELYFINNFQMIDEFQDGQLADARLLGDGYDFQIQVNTAFFLAEVKGVRSNYGAIRLTKNEYNKASEYGKDYGLVIVSNLDNVPKLVTIFDPINELTLTKNTVQREQITYHSQALHW
jgi:hypothetical protein